MTYHNKLDLRLDNHVTGEVINFTVINMQEAEEWYLKIAETLKIWDHRASQLREYIGKQVEDKYDFGDGFTGMWIPKSTKRYDPAVVRKYLDEDQLSEVMDINSTKLKALFKQLVEDGKGIAGAWTDIESSAEVRPGKPYFVIKKG